MATRTIRGLAKDAGDGRAEFHQRLLLSQNVRTGCEKVQISMLMVVIKDCLKYFMVQCLIVKANKVIISLKALSISKKRGQKLIVRI